MDRRFLVAVVLMVVVLVGPSLFMKRLPPARHPTADTTVTAQPQTPPEAPESTRTVRGARARVAQPAQSRYDTVALALPAATLRFTTHGAALDQVTIPGLKSFRPGDQKGPVRLLRSDGRMLASRLVVGGDTVAFDAASFRTSSREGAVRMSGQVGALALTVSFAPVSGRPFLVDVQGSIDGLESGALLLISLGDGFANTEADSLDNYRNYAVAVRRTRPENTDFRSLDPGLVQTIGGPLDWVVVKSKYFMGALLSSDSTRPQFGGAILVGGPREARLATRMQTWVTLPVGPDGQFRYQLYVGPQSHETLSPLGRALDQASPYGWFLKGIVMPAAGFITRLFIWMHQNLRLSYGLVLVVFGVLVRLLLWPLNQRAMKSQVAMMAVQPILKDLQARYKNDPTKLQSEMMKVYKEHGVNPLGGCLPMLLPMPVLLALFFVFSRAIELRGTPFLWLPDLSLRDPLFITPLVMGGSMYLLSKLSQSGMPPNPQAKMMTVMMPIMMTVLFFNFASGLNLYYAVSNLVSLPQQYLINKARMAEMGRRQVSMGGKT